MDIASLRRWQAGVNLGHSPWLADARWVATLFLLQKRGIEHITQTTPLPDLVAVHRAPRTIVYTAVDDPAARYVFLEQPVDPGAHGVWAVVGYDPPA